MSIRELVERLVQERGVDPLLLDPGDEPEVRLAIYDSALAAPQVESVRAEDFHVLVGELAARTYAVCRERGGRIPFVVIREIMENLIHAYFRNATITVLDDGNTIRISDGGPGIRNKTRALEPGFSTATREMRRFIRGVGSGLPVAHEQLQFLGGTLLIEDNLDRGTVITLRVAHEIVPAAPQQPVEPDTPARPAVEVSARQRKVLLLIAELGAAGPTLIAKELDISHSTAYRELQALQTLHLVTGKGRGVRTLSEEGIAFLDEVFKP
jgi:histidine kinase/DNA gyrase B/HSP90-like ATPase